jgi:OmcA/MtrC family decaheme c-type cytochrome
MRMPFSVFAVGRYAVALTVAAGSVLLMSAPNKDSFTPRDKAYYADPSLVDFVRPGLNITIVSATVAADGTMSVRYKLTDPKGLALDRDGIQTPGAVSVSFIAAYIPKDGTQYVTYTTRSQGPSPITKVTAIQSGADSGGTTQKVADGEYVYTLATKAVPFGGGAYDKTATHTIGAYGSRNLTEFDLGTYYASGVYNWVPDGSKVTQTRDVIKTQSCLKCHGELGFHGGSRRGMEVCVLCHTAGSAKANTNIDPDTGNSFDMPTMTHRIHAGEELPSVQAGKPYQIVGNQQRVSDWSTVAFPAGLQNCEFCHEQNTGAAQKDAYLKPSRSACGSCHDNVNFATGENHANLAQVSDNQCSTCHQVQGELEYDISIKGAHIVERLSSQNPGLYVTITKLENGSAGKKPVVTFTVKDKKGNGLTMANLTGARNRLAVTMAGPTADYGYTSFGSDVTTQGYVTEDVVSAANTANAAKCSNDGTCTYTFLHAIPADAKGSFTMSFEGRRDIAINPGTKKEVMAEFGAITKAYTFSVDGSAVQERRKIVDIAKCNNCHGFLSLHGENRNQIEQCVMCHNPSETDSSRRSSAPAAEKAKPNQSVNMALMIHKIHKGEQLKEDGQEYTVIGFGGSVNAFDEVRYPTFTRSGSAGNLTRCDMCHVNGSEGNLPVGKNVVRDPQGRLNPAPAATAACLSCHLSQQAAAHAQSNTDAKFGESCGVCHGSSADHSVARSHAQ